MRPRLSATFALVAVLSAESSAHAEPLHGEMPGWCGRADAEVLRWTPSAGPLAAFVADAYLAHPSLFIGLGYDAAGFWSAEADIWNDACDDCSRLSFVRTTSAGARTVFRIGEGADGDPTITPEQRRLALKKKIFALAAGELDVKALQQSYKLTMPKHDAEGAIERFSGWFAQVTRAGTTLRFAIAQEQVACSCTMSWIAYKLAPPKKAGP